MWRIGRNGSPASWLLPTLILTSNRIGKEPMTRFHGRDLRKGRWSEPGRLYLVTAVTAGRTPLFSDVGIGRLLVLELKHAAECQFATSLAWVVMPDHLHWLISPESECLSRIIQRVKSRSAIAINRALNTSGPVWQRGFHDRAVRNDEDIRAIARYVVANPLRAGLVDRIGNYPLWDANWLM